jgi:hypothetical protein
MPRALYPRDRVPVPLCIGGWVGPRAGLDECGKSCFHPDSIPGLSIPYRIAIPTELARSTYWYSVICNRSTSWWVKVLLLFFIIYSFTYARAATVSLNILYFMHIKFYNCNCELSVNALVTRFFFLKINSSRVVHANDCVYWVHVIKAFWGKN